MGPPNKDKKKKRKIRERDDNDNENDTSTSIIDKRKLAHQDHQNKHKNIVERNLKSPKEQISHGDNKNSIQSSSQSDQIKHNKKKKKYRKSNKNNNKNNFQYPTPPPPPQDRFNKSNHSHRHPHNPETDKKRVEKTPNRSINNRRMIKKKKSNKVDFRYTKNTIKKNKYTMDDETFTKFYPLVNPIKETSKDSKLTLNIFDFDSTLFKSPEPNPELWNASMIGKLKAMKSEDGLGWFQETITLDEPYVPSNPSIEWFNESVLNEAIKSINTPDTITCLLTGRTFIYEEIIKRILKSVDLSVNYIGLKMVTQPGQTRVTTMDFKQSFIHRIIDAYPGRVNKIEMYDDRIKHVEQFRSFLQSIPNLSHHNVVHINEKPQYIDEEEEIRMVDELIARNGKPGFQRKKMVSYTAAVLDKESKQLVRSWFNLPDDWEVKCHHSTMNLGGWNPKLWKNYAPSSTTTTTHTITHTTTTTTTTTATATITDQMADLKVTVTKTVEEEEEEKRVQELTTRYPVGQKVELTVEAIGLSGAALALKVSGAATANTIAHITVAHHPRAKPVESNNITHWKSLGEIVNDKNVLSFVQQPKATTAAADTAPAEGATPAVTSPTKKQASPFDYPSVSININNIPPHQLKLNAIIKEVGLSSYESTNPSPKGGKSAGGNNKNVNNNNNKGGPNFGELIQKYHDVDRKEIGQLIKNIQQWIQKENVGTDTARIEEYIKALNITSNKN